MNITFATTADERAAVFRLRYAIYVEEMHRPQRYADHARRQVEDPLDAFGHLLVATIDGELVGALRTNFLRDGDVGEYAALYGLDGLTPHQRRVTSITTRLMVATQQRSGTLALRLARAVFEFGLASGIDIDFLDCNPPLEQFFRRLGHRQVRTGRHPEYGDVSVMRLHLSDREWLLKIKSPLLRTRGVHRDHEALTP